MALRTIKGREISSASSQRGPCGDGDDRGSISGSTSGGRVLKMARSSILGTAFQQVCAPLLPSPCMKFLRRAQLLLLSWPFAEESFLGALKGTTINHLPLRRFMEPALQENHRYGDPDRHRSPAG